MFVPFNTLPPTSKVWIYQADKKLTSQQLTIISDALRSFTQEWLVHGAPLEASFEIRFDQFIILAADDAASGCSIDTSVRIMKELSGKTGVDFFNRNLIGFLRDQEVALVALPKLKSTFLKEWNAESLYFNNAVSSKEEFLHKWIVPAKSTWLNRYALNAPAAH
jgi:hypothetical protein